jgi:hypothetical protein
MSDNGVVWTVQFTAVANIPWQFGLPVPIVTQFLDRHINPAQTDGAYDDQGRIFTEVHCPQPSYTPVFDPACPDLVLPPITPPVKFGCFSPPINWKRFSFSIPQSYLPKWTDMVPLIQVHTRDGTYGRLRNMRIRFYEKSWFDPDTHPCGYCADFWISYIPEESTLQIDGRDQSILVLDPGQSRRADGLVFDTNHMPFTWPSLSCGIGYTVTIDILQTQKRPRVDFSLVPRVK